MPFRPATNTQAYLKAGIMGLQKSGKTFTASEIAIGLRKYLADRGLPGGDRPVYMCDTETGSSWLKKKFDAAGVPLEVDTTRSFKDLAADMKTVSEEKAILLIDSITHFWTELCSAYAKKHKRKRLTFQDWTRVKGIWQEMFTDEYVNGTSHVIMCGRQGYEYDFFETEDGSKQLEKTAIKMRAEGETGYEPSLLVVMERHQELRGTQITRVWRTAYILGDRANLIDGKSFDNPTFEDFLPHIESLNLGGTHAGVDTSRNSESIIERETDSRLMQQQREVILDEIMELGKKHYPSQSGDDKQARGDLMERHFSTRSWKKIETYGFNELRTGYNAMHLELEGKPAYPEMSPLESSEGRTPNDEIPF